MLATAVLSNGPINFDAGIQRLGYPLQTLLIRPFGLPSRMFQPDRDQAYRTPVLSAFDFHP